MSVRAELIRLLADGETHSGTALAQALGISRSAVWKQVHRLHHIGLELRPGAGRGYRLARRIELLDRGRIMAALDPQARTCCEGLAATAVTGSTNVDLAAAPAPGAGCWRGLLAEFQTLGRGRRGRRWQSGFATGLCLSLAWVFATAPGELPALPLAAGLAVRRALARTGAAGVTLKWPNDVVFDGAKLGGILVDVDGDARGPLRVIVGVGLNLTVPAALAQVVGRDGGLPPAGLDQVPGACPAGRNVLAAAVLGELAGMLREFGTSGFQPLADEWRRHDYLFGRAVTVAGHGGRLAGVACGIAADGALLVDHPEGVAHVFNGDVSLRSSA